jgi:hypothetical protein
MRQLLINGKEYEVNEKNYLNTIDQLAKGYTILAGAYHNYHESGFADWKGTFEVPDKGQFKYNKTFESQIDDVELSSLFNSLKEQLQSMKNLDFEIIAWLEGFVGLPSVNNRENRTHLGKRLKKVIINGPDGNLQGPAWAMQPEYKVFVEKSRKIMDVMSDVQNKVDQRIKQLLENSM